MCRLVQSCRQAGFIRISMQPYKGEFLLGMLDAFVLSRK